jgi:hypothetical protein
MKVRIANPDDVSLIFSFIQKKAEFVGGSGAFAPAIASRRESLIADFFRSFLAVKLAGSRYSKRHGAS